MFKSRTFIGILCSFVHRPHPNECSGSDLDGDIYFVCWDQELIPPRTSEPMDYTPEPAQILDHDVTIEVNKKIDHFGYIIIFSR